MVHLREDADRSLRRFSSGMIRRVGIAQALLNEPRVLLLDEPTASVDPGERLHFREVIASLCTECCVVISTHIIADLDAMATEMILLDGGRLVWAGTPEGLLADATGQVWALTVAPSTFEHLRATERISAVTQREGNVQVRLLASTCPYPAAVLVEPTLEDVYLLSTATGQKSIGGREKCPNFVVPPSDTVGERPRPKTGTYC